MVVMHVLNSHLNVYQLFSSTELLNVFSSVFIADSVQISCSQWKSVFFFCLNICVVKQTALVPLEGTAESMNKYITIIFQFFFKIISFVAIAQIVIWWMKELKWVNVIN